MSKPSVQSLHDSGEYRFVGSFMIDEMSQFVFREAGFKSISESVPGGKKGNLRWGLIGVLMVFLSLYGVLFGFAMNMAFTESGVIALVQVLIGSVGYYLFVLPFQVRIRALCFKLLGAKQVGFSSSKKGIRRRTYAYAQRFVMTLRENALVISLPSLLVAVLIVVGWILVPGWRVVCIMLLFPHTIACGDDFIILVHAWKKRKQLTYIYYDDLDEKRTYFFEKQ